MKIPCHKPYFLQPTPITFNCSPFLSHLFFFYYYYYIFSLGLHSLSVTSLSSMPISSTSYDWHPWFCLLLAHIVSIILFSTLISPVSKHVSHYPQNRQPIHPTVVPHIISLLCTTTTNLPTSTAT